MKLLLKMKQLLAFGLRNLKYWNPGPGRDNAGNILFRHIRKVCLFRGTKLRNLSLDSLLLSSEFLSFLEASL